MTDTESYWRGRARALSATVNAVLWVEAGVVGVISLHILAAVGILWFRREMTFATGVFVWIYLGSLLAVGLWSAYRNRKRWYSVDSAFSRMEVHGGLFGELSAAAAGKVAWPAPQNIENPLRFRMTSGLSWMLLTFVFILAALWMPIGQKAVEVYAQDIEPPPDVTTVETWLEVLKEDPAMDPVALEKFEDQLESLESKDAEDWYDQASLEGANALRQDLEHSVQDMNRRLEQAQMAIEQAEAMSNQEAVAMDLGAEAMSALSALPQGAIPWRDSVLEQLARDGQSPMKLDSQAMESLKESMQRSQQTAETLASMGTMRRLTEEEMQQLMAQCQNPGAGQGKDGSGKLGEGPGQGGPTEGAGEAPLFYLPDGTPFIPETFEAVSNQDLTRASIGETIETRVVSSEDSDEDVGTGLLNADTTLEVGAGGAATWQQNLNPRESARLKKFFQREDSE